MKQCPNCHAFQADHAMTCTSCGKPLQVAERLGTIVPGPAVIPELKRPDGGTFILAGILLMLASVGVPVFVQLMSDYVVYQLFGLVGIGFSLGLTLFVVGHVQRAVWFLPGEERKLDPSYRPLRPATVTPATSEASASATESTAAA